MKVVFKYTLMPSNPWSVAMPRGAQVLSAQAQGENLCVWALVDPEQRESESRFFRVFGTGHSIPDLPLRFVDTTQMGMLVWHVFEQT